MIIRDIGSLGQGGVPSNRSYPDNLVNVYTTSGRPGFAIFDDYPEQ